MLRNYFKVALRNLLRRKGFTAVSTFGLTIGVACSLIILAFVRYEYGVNAQFDENVYVINSTWSQSDIAQKSQSFAPLGPALVEQFPSVEAYTRYTGVTVSLKADQDKYQEAALITNTNFFDLFGFSFLHGNPETALNRINTVVLTETLAQKFFGRTDVVGEVLLIETWAGESKVFEISGVLAEPPFNTITYLYGSEYNGIFMSMDNTPDFYQSLDLENWSYHYIINYIELKDGQDPKELEAQLASVVERNVPGELASKVVLSLKPVHDLYLDLKDGAVRKRARLLLGLVTVIMFIAGFNFVNLMTSQASTRSREVGMRKVLGARQFQLVAQYISEALLIGIIVTIAGVIIAHFALRPFGNFVNHTLSLDYTDPVILLIISGLFLITSLGAGAYPAFYLSSLQPVFALNNFSTSGKPAINLRKGLVLLQITVAIMLFVGARIVSQQASYLTERPTGFEKENVFVISSIPRNWSEEGVQKLDVVKQQLEQLPNVRDVSAMFSVPGTSASSIWEMQRPDWSDDRTVPLQALQVQDNYLELFDIGLVSGRFFSEYFAASTDSMTIALVLNEAAVKAFGWDSAVDKRLTWVKNPNVSIEVIGVVEDYNYQSLYEPIRPLALIHLSQMPLYRYLALKVTDTDLEQIQAVWNEVYPEAIFDYFFLDDYWSDLYVRESKTKTIIEFAALLALVLAGVGLLGMVSIDVVFRRAEIGVRKVLGASVTDIMVLLSRSLLKIFGIAFVIAMPLSYILTKRWLDGFTYSIEIQLSTFFITGILILGGVLLLSSYHSFRAATADPVKAIRHE